MGIVSIGDRDNVVPGASAMRLRRPRFRLWMMMLAIALVAAVFFAFLMRRRAREFTVRARTYKDAASGAMQIAESWVSTVEINRRYMEFEGARLGIAECGHEEHPTDSPAEIRAQLAESWDETADLEELIAAYRKRAATFSRLRKKYDDAAKRPWLSLSSDEPIPPEPG